RVCDAGWAGLKAGRNPMDFYLGLMQIIGVHTLLGLSAYCVLLTGQVSLAQAGFFAIGAYVAGMLTVLAQWPLVPALGASAVVAGVMACAVGFPALRVKGLMLVVATIAFGEAVRLFFFNFTYQVQAGNLKLGPHGAEGFRQIRYFPEHGWTTLDVMLFIWAVVALVMACVWWLDRSRAGAVLRAVGEDDRTKRRHQHYCRKGLRDDDRRRHRWHRRRHFRALHDAYRASAVRRRAGDLRHRLSDSRRSFQCVRNPARRRLRPGLPDRRSSLHGRLAQSAVRRVDRARDECAPPRIARRWGRACPQTADRPEEGWRRCLICRGSPSILEASARSTASIWPLRAGKSLA